MLAKILIAAHKYLLLPAIYYVCWKYMFTLCRSVWVLCGVEEILRGRCFCYCAVPLSWCAGTTQ